MLYNEFKERSGLNATEEEFNHINAIYMSCGDRMDNPTFCKNYPSVHSNPIVEELYLEIDRKAKQIEKLASQFQMMEKAYFTILENPENDRAREFAIKAYNSEGEYVKALLSYGLDLYPADKDYVIENIF